MKIYRSFTNPESFQIGESPHFVQEHTATSDLDRFIIKMAKDSLQPGETGEILWTVSIVRKTSV